MAMQGHEGDLEPGSFSSKRAMTAGRQSVAESAEYLSASSATVQPLLLHNLDILAPC